MVSKKKGKYIFICKHDAPSWDEIYAKHENDNIDCYSIRSNFTINIYKRYKKMYSFPLNIYGGISVCGSFNYDITGITIKKKWENKNIKYGYFNFTRFNKVRDYLLRNKKKILKKINKQNENSLMQYNVKDILSCIFKTNF